MEGINNVGVHRVVNLCILKHVANHSTAFKRRPLFKNVEAAKNFQ